MPIDAAAAVGAAPATQAVSWAAKDVLLYHLALGAGVPATGPGELRYAYEKDLHVLPTFGVVVGGGFAGGRGLRLPGIDVDLAAVLHAGQEIQVHAPLPPEAEAQSTGRVAAVYDKGSAALIVLEAQTSDSAGRPLYTTRSQIFVRGEGGFGGDRGPSSGKLTPPDRAPDAVTEVVTLPQQALLYRLCGDRNPLHADPDFAKLAGFDRPILHGLCTYGIVCKALVDTMLGSDVSRVGTYRARFTGVLFPGETIRVRAWEDGGRLTVTATAADRDDAAVLAGALEPTGQVI
jgi:acyl dehydratase